MRARTCLFLVFAMFLSIGSFIYADSVNNKDVEIAGIKFIRKGMTRSFTEILENEFDLRISCTEDTGVVDIVFVLDTTGSMSGYINDAVDHMIEFAEVMDSLGYRSAFGIVTYGDGYHFPHGTTLTEDIDTFVAWVDPIGSSGGADAPETALDAIMGAVDNYEWRIGALKVIILLTDACFCQYGEDCAQCISAYTGDEVATTLLDNGFMFFGVTESDLSCSYCADETYSEWWVHTISDSTGGSWFDIEDSFSGIYAALVGLLGTFNVIQLDVVNNTDHEIDSVVAYLDYGSCITLLYGDVMQIREGIAVGETVSIYWRVDFATGCEGPEGCFTIYISSTDTSIITPDPALGCMYIQPCWCSPVVAENITPEVGVWSACDPQPIQIGIYDDDDGVNEETIIMNLNGVELEYPAPRLTFADDTLTYMPDPDEFSSGDSVYYGLLDVEDMASCTLDAPVSGWFLVDLDPPILENEEPEDSLLSSGSPTDIAIDLDDIHAGLDEETIYMVINGTDSFTLDSAALTYDSGRLHLDPTGIYSWGMGDTVQVCVYASDIVSNEYCGPNSSEYCWFFMIDELFLFFEDTIVHAGDDITYSLQALEPARFSITNYELWVKYNPNVATLNAVITSGSASDGFAMVWDTTGGMLHIEASNSSPVGVSNDYIFLDIHINDDVSGGAFTAMQLTDATFDSGRVSYRSEDAMILVEWDQQPWLHDLIFYAYDGEGEYLEYEYLTIGCNASADEGFDPEYDIISTPPWPSKTEVYIELIDPLYPSFTRLQRSLKNLYEMPVIWRIITVDEPGSLWWNPNHFPPGVITLNGYIDMKRDSFYFYAANETLIIMFSQPGIDVGDFGGCPGWNLKSLPTAITVPGWTSGIEEIIFGPLEYDARTKTWVRNDPPRMGFGFWVYSLNEFNVDIGGIPITSVSVPVYQGWNFVGSVSTTATYETDPPGIINTSGGVYEFDCELQTYIPATILTIEPGKGYCVFCFEDGILTITP